MNEILIKHLEEARKNSSTIVAIEMFSHNGEFMKNFAANSYIMALSEIDTLTSRIAALEAQNKKLVEALERAVNDLQLKTAASAEGWATSDVAADYAKKLMSPYRALLSEVAQ